LHRVVDAGVEQEDREALLGETKDGKLLFVVHVERTEAVTRIISARRATAAEEDDYEEYP
jgi:uncharacterized DUF497 family protein